MHQRRLRPAETSNANEDRVTNNTAFDAKVTAKETSNAKNQLFTSVDLPRYSRKER